MFNCFWNLKVLIVLIDCGGNNASGFCFLARLAVRGGFLPAVFNLTGHTGVSVPVLSSGVLHT